MPPRYSGHMHEEWKTTVRAVLFDFDGVLVRSTHASDEEWREWAQHFHLDADEVVAFQYGRRAVETMAHFAAQANPTYDIAEQRRAFLAQELNDTDIHAYPGARELVDSVPK